MAKGRSGKLNLSQKVEKDYPEFVSVVAGMSADELEKKLASYAKEQENSLKAEESDAELQSTKEKLKELKAPYGDIKKALRLKMRYIIALIEEKGGDV